MFAFISFGWMEHSHLLYEKNGCSTINSFGQTFQVLTAVNHSLQIVNKCNLFFYSQPNFNCNCPVLLLSVQVAKTVGNTTLLEVSILSVHCWDVVQCTLFAFYFWGVLALTLWTLENLMMLPVLDILFKFGHFPHAGHGIFFLLPSPKTHDLFPRVKPWKQKW